jgi:hypothetical protein
VAITFRTVTGDAARLLSFDAPPKNLSIRVRTNLPAGTPLIDKANNRLMLGSDGVDVADDGTFSAPNLIDHATGAGDVNPTGIQYYFDLAFTDPVTYATKKMTLGPFSITANGDLSDLVATQYVPPEFQSTFLDQARAILAQQTELSGIDSSDSAMAYNAQHGATFPGVLSASFVRTVVVNPSGDTTGVTDRTAIVAAIADVATGGGTVEFTTGAFYINGAQIVVPDMVNLRGQGGSFIRPATRIVCVDATSGIAFGTRTSGTVGGTSGHMLIDGNTIATQPLYIGLTVQCVYMDLNVASSAGDGWVMQNTQNARVYGCNSFHALGSNLKMIDGVSNCQLWGFEPGGASTYHWHMTKSGNTTVPGTPEYPFDNHLYGGISEYDNAFGSTTIATKGIYQEYGDQNGIHQFQIVSDGAETGYVLVHVQRGGLHIDGGFIQCNHAAPYRGTGIQVDAGAAAYLDGQTAFLGLDTVFNVGGDLYINGFVNLVSYTTYRAGTGTIHDKISSGDATLGTFPIFTKGNYALSTGGNTITDALWLIDPAAYTVPVGKKLQFRFVASASDGLANGDEFAVIFVPFSGSLPGGSNLLLDNANGDGVAFAVGPWSDFPTSRRAGYLLAKNDTANRGHAQSASVEIRLTNV